MAPIKLKNVCAYCRVSKQSDGLERSLETQIEYFRNKIKTTHGWKFTRIFFDNGVSGTGIDKRQGFKDMINECSKGNIDIILTKSVTRFARNTVDLLNTIRYLKSINVDVYFEKENIHTITKQGELMLSILASFAQAEAESISQNVRWGKIKKMERGEDQAHNLFGYDRDGKTYTINKEEAKIVKLIFREFLKGNTYTEIAAMVRQLKGKPVLTRRLNKFTYPQVKVILKNEKYTGTTVLQKHYSQDGISHKRILNTGQRKKYKIENTHPPIISLKEFEKAQEKIMWWSKKLRHGDKPVYKYERL